MTRQLDRQGTGLPELSKEEVEVTRAAERALQESRGHAMGVTINVQSDDGVAIAVPVPAAVLEVLARSLGAAARGQSIIVVSPRRELSTVEAAAALGVSRPFLIREIEAGRLKHRMVGTHRRILYTDLLEYERAMRAGQSAALDEMAEDARSTGLHY